LEQHLGKMKYIDAVKQSMETLALDEKVLFIGYSLAYNGKVYGTLNNIPREKILESPLAENLMMGLGIGMSLEGFFPIVVYERHDFLLNASDAIVNHLDKIERMSRGQFKTPVIVRTIVGNNKPLDPGAQHTQDFTEAFKSMVTFPVYEPSTSEEVLEVYNSLLKNKNTAMVVERKSLYNKEF
jgi:pyruvate/2-oxoglutarate/acetoin dehydrogenase E1 component